MLHPEPPVSKGRAANVTVEDEMGGVQMAGGVVGDQALAVVIGEGLDAVAPRDRAFDLFRDLALGRGDLDIPVGKDNILGSTLYSVSKKMKNN